MGFDMLKWALFFFVISIVAGIFGFTGIAAGAAEVARILFFPFVLVWVVLLLLVAMAGSTLS